MLDAPNTTGETKVGKRKGSVSVNQPAAKKTRGGNKERVKLKSTTRNDNEDTEEELFE